MNNQITHFHLFFGLGSGAAGFQDARPEIPGLQGQMHCLGGMDVDAAGAADFQRLAGVPGTVRDLFDRDQYVAWHGRQPPAGWVEATPADVHAAAGYETPDIVFLSAPCLPADGLVLTESGPRAISEVRAGEMVLTHKGRMRPVTHVGTHHYTGTMYGFRLNGTVDTQWFTDEHPMWVRRVVRNAASGLRRQLGNAGFVPARDVRAGDRIGFPVQEERKGTAAGFVSALGNPQEITKGGHTQGRYAKSEHVAVVDRVRNLTAAAADPGLWFLIGCYLGDGYRGTGNRYEVNYCVGAADGELACRIKNAVTELGLPCYEDRDGGATNIKLRVRSRHLHMICGAFGDGADKKCIPAELMTLETELLRELVGGYRATDGSTQSRRTMRRGNSLQASWKIPSVSLQLLRDMQRLLLRLGIFGSIHKCWPGGPQTIMGREVQTRPRWELTVRLDPQKRTCFEFIDSVVWVRVREVELRQSDEPVWNLSVHEDDTFCAPMMATHNCKGFSGLLPAAHAGTARYQALNMLTLRGVWLMLEAWADDPVPVILFENVPRIATRGRHLLDQITSMLSQYGYAVRETTHDCGELGGLAQSRKRFLLIARHVEKVPACIYEPPKRSLRAVGEVLSRMPLPGAEEAGVMHRVPRLSWKTWVRLAFVEAGKDWRSLNRLAVENGHLSDYLIVPHQAHAGYLGVREWDQPTGTVTSRGMPSCGAFSVADPRAAAGAEQYQQFGVRRWADTSGAVTGQRSPGQGTFSVADPRHDGPAKFNNQYRIVPWSSAAGAVTSAHGKGQCVADPRTGWPDTAHTSKLRVVGYDQMAYTVTGARFGSGGGVVADPRRAGPTYGNYAVTNWAEPAGTVISGSTTGQGAYAVADPRPGLARSRHNYLTGGHYGVTAWDEHAGAVSAAACHDNGRWSVADPRPMPAPDDKLICRITALDGTWHRPFTTLELAALQSIYDPDDYAEAGYDPFVLHGSSDSAWRERIGNAVPRRARSPRRSAAPSSLPAAARASNYPRRRCGSAPSPPPLPCQETQHEDDPRRIQGSRRPPRPCAAA